MEPRTLKILAVIFLVLAIISGFVAWERYAATGEESELQIGEGGPGIRLEQEPVMPVASKYAIFLALLFLAAAGGCAYAGFRKQPSVTKEPSVGDQAGRAQGPTTTSTQTGGPGQPARPTQPHSSPGQEEDPFPPSDQPPKG